VRAETGADPAAPLLAARDVTLYLLSLLAVAGAQIAWLPMGAGALFSQALLLAFASFFGKLLAEVVSGAWTSASRRRNRLIFLAGYGVLACIALAVALGGGEIVARETQAFGLLHSFLLLLAPLVGLDEAVFANALLLVVLTALRGGTPAAVSSTGFAGLAGFFLAFDHASRRLQEWPRARGRLLGPVALDAARLLLPVVGGLGLFFSVAPPRPYARASAGHEREAPQVSGEAYRWLALLALGGGGLIFGLGRLLRSWGGDEAPLLELVDSHQVLEEPLHPPPPEEGVYGTPQARVIRAYVRFLARAREAGLKLPGHQTPREIEGRVREPRQPLALLTGLFMDARYGSSQPTAEEVRDAERAAHALVVSLRGRRVGRRV
jgi:hypothetical protein